ncbi:hypothetical protein DFJ63DRAFT_93836 [Scheffersomyces coipomensis]|uniref:uncharacterized protein n=1 Tax=Scheffersomyces coipomensis TaxID=1788519 RepID=UPI00315D5598
MSLLVESNFGTSVQQAVQATASQNKPLFVLLSKGESDNESIEFENKFINESNIHQLKSHFILLKLIDDTVEFGYFKQIFSDLILPSFYIVDKGKLLDVITFEAELDTFDERINKIVNTTPNDTSLPPSTNSPPVVDNQPSSSSTPVPLEQVDSQATNTRVETEEHPVSTTQEHKLDPKREESLREHKKKVALAKKKQNEERSRLRALLKADQKEREIKKAAEQASYKDQSSSPTTNGTQTTQHTHSDECTLSIKLFDGNSIRHDFKHTQTLNDVRNWLDQEIEIIPPSNSMPSFATSSYPQPTNYVFHRPVLPRITYTDEQEFISLLDLELCPRSALILKPVYDDKYSKAYPDSKTSNSVISRIGGTIGRVGHALYSFFDYGVDNQHELSHENSFENPDGSSRSRSNTSGYSNDINSGSRPNIVSIDDNRASSASLINFHDPPPAHSPMLESPTVGTIESTNPSNYPSRASSPVQLGSLHTISRVQTIHDEQHTTSDSRDKKDDTYNGNSINLTSNDDDK